MDVDGKCHLDFLGGLAVTSLGHAHPAVTEAIVAQAGRLIHVSNLYGTEHGWPLAQTLDRLLGGGGQIFFANSGAEANECALKLARKFGGRGRHVVVSAFGSFHGRTLATLHATGQPAKHEPFQPLPEGFRHVAWNDLEALESVSTRVWGRCCSSRYRARAASIPPTPRTSPGSGGSATSGASCSWSTRCRPDWAAPVSGSASSTSACSPMW